MYPHTHLIAGLIIALIGVKIGLLGVSLAIILVLLSVLIDIDHLTKHYSRNRNMSLWQCWNYCVIEEPTKKGLFLHYPAAFIVITLFGIAFYFWSAAWAYVLLGACYTHYFLDFLFSSLLIERKKIRMHILGLYMPLTAAELVLDIVGIAAVIGLLIYLS